MFIQTENTPNPETIKFLPGCDVLIGEPLTFERDDVVGIKRSPLAGALFGVEGVQSVFLGEDFISVTKTVDSDWDYVKAPVLTKVMEHFVAELPVVLEEDHASDDTAQEEGGDSAIVRQLKEILDTRVRPAVAQDGGDIVFRGFEEESGVVFLELRGACSGCPSATVTLKQGVEQMLKYYVPEVTEIREYSSESGV